MASRAAASKIHVLFLNAHGGVGADFAVHLSLARTLDRDKARVSAATSVRETPGASARAAFEQVRDITLLPLELGRAIGQERGMGRAGAVLENARGMVGLVSLARWCRANRVDVIHVTERPRQALFGLLVARMSGCACLIHAHTSYYPQDVTRFSNWRLHQADAVVGVSRFTADSFQRVANLPTDRVFAVHNAVDSSVFDVEPARHKSAAMRARLGVAADAPLIGCVARLMRWKGQATLLDAFATVRQELPTARLVLAGVSSDMAPDGVGDFRDYLLRQIDRLGLSGSVILPGFLPQSGMPAFYAALDVVAHPALEEPFGLAVVEAMASMRPVVAINGGGVPEIIRDGIDGLLVAGEQAQPLAQAILRVYRDRELAQRLVRSARQRVVETFTPQNQADAMLRVYQQVVERRRRGLVLQTRAQPT
jgi:glycosyltransferase involved in cell wall biosynthesis